MSDLLRRVMQDFRLRSGRGLSRQECVDAADEIERLEELERALEDVRVSAERHWFCAAALPPDEKTLIFLGKAFEEIKDTAICKRGEG